MREAKEEIGGGEGKQNSEREKGGGTIKGCHYSRRLTLIFPRDGPDHSIFDLLHVDVHSLARSRSLLLGAPRGYFSCTIRRE